MPAHGWLTTLLALCSNSSDGDGAAGGTSGGWVTFGNSSVAATGAAPVDDDDCIEYDAVVQFEQLQYHLVKHRDAQAKLREAQVCVCVCCVWGLIMGSNMCLVDPCTGGPIPAVIACRL